jgi:hypothetical protein
MDQETLKRLKQAMRLQAIENLVCNTTAVVLALAEVLNPGSFAEFEQRMRAPSTPINTDGSDPAISDLAASELEEAVGALLDRIRLIRK